MTTHLLFLLLGLGAGSVYGLLALGLVLKYRAAGVVDFAHGAVAMISAYVFVTLRSDGLLELPWPVLPHELRLGSQGLPLAVAVPLTLGYAALLGLLLYWLVYRPLLTAAPLTKVCASVGVMLYLQATTVLNFGTRGKSTPAVLPSGSLQFGGVLVPVDRLWFTAVVIGLAAALAYLYRHTVFGLATRAGAENEKGAALIGLSANRIAAQNWVLATLIAAVSGILISPIANLDPTSYTLFVVPALGIALVARFTSFLGSAAAGLALGMAQSLIIQLLADHSWLPQQGVPDGIPFLVILVVMTLWARSLTARGQLSDWHNPSVGRPQAPARTAVVTFALGAAVLVLLQGSLRAAFISSIIAACICLSLVVLTGYVGQVSLAQLSFAGFSAFTLSHLAADSHVPFPLSLLLAALAAVPLGILIGLPALRVRGVNLAVITLAAGSALGSLLFDNASFSGGLGGRTIPSPTLFGIDLGIAHRNDYPRVVFGVMVLAIVVVVGYGVARLRNSPTGRMLIAVRSNERAAAASGIPVARAKLLAFAMSSFIAGLGGGLLAYQQGTISPASFAVFESLGLIAIAYVAGIGRISGAATAGILFASAGLFISTLDKYVGLGRYATLVAGLALAVTAIKNPNGVASPTPSGRAPADLLARTGARLVGVRPRVGEGHSQARGPGAASTPPDITVSAPQASSARSSPDVSGTPTRPEGGPAASIPPASPVTP